MRSATALAGHQRQQADPARSTRMSSFAGGTPCAPRFAVYPDRKCHAPASRPCRAGRGRCGRRLPQSSASSGIGRSRNPSLRCSGRAYRQNARRDHRHIACGWCTPTAPDETAHLDCQICQKKSAEYLKISDDQNQRSQQSFFDIATLYTGG